MMYSILFSMSNYTNSTEELFFNINGNETTNEPTPEAPDAAYVAFLEHLRFWIQRVLVPIIVTIGIVGNSVTIVVLTRRRMRSSTNLYLTALATSDMFYLVFSFTLSLFHYPDLKVDATYLRYYSIGHMFADACSNTSVLLTVSFTLERYIAVCHPIRGKVLCTESRAKFVIAAVFLFAIVCVLPTPFEYILVEEWDTETNTTIYFLDNSWLGKDPTYRNVFYWFTTLIFTLIPLTLLAIFNSFLIYAVHQSKQQRRKMTSIRGDRQETSASQETKITIMLIAVVVLFLVCQVPTSIILLFIAHTKHSTPNEEIILRGLGNMCNFLMAINASCNFLLYCAFSDKYRKTFLLTFLRCWYKPPSPVHSQSVYYRSTVTEGTLSRSPSCRDRSPSQRSFTRSNSTRSCHGSTRSRGRGSIRSIQDGSSQNKQRYLTVPNGDPHPDVTVTPRNSPSPPPAPIVYSGRKSIMMCFRLPKGPLRILGARKEETDELRSQSVPLTRQTEHNIVIATSPNDKSDKLTCL